MHHVAIADLVFFCVMAAGVLLSLTAVAACMLSSRISRAEEAAIAPERSSGERSL